MYITDLVNLYNGNIFKTSLYIYIFQDEKCRPMRNLSLSTDKSNRFVIFGSLLCDKKFEKINKYDHLFILFNVYLLGEL